MGCDFCEQYYKKGIFSNVDSFVRRLCDREVQVTPEDGCDDVEVYGVEEDEVSEDEDVGGESQLSWVT
jgi:hypothetical protein